MENRARNGEMKSLHFQGKLNDSNTRKKQNIGCDIIAYTFFGLVAVVPKVLRPTFKIK